MSLISPDDRVRCLSEDVERDQTVEAWQRALETAKTFDEWEEIMAFSWEVDESGKMSVFAAQRFDMFELIRAIRDGDICKDDAEEDWHFATTRGLMVGNDEEGWVPSPGLTWEMVEEARKKL
jgi:hypothetical protein